METFMQEEDRVAFVEKQSRALMDEKEVVPLREQEAFLEEGDNISIADAMVQGYLGQDEAAETATLEKESDLLSENITVDKSPTQEEAVEFAARRDSKETTFLPTRVDGTTIQSVTATVTPSGKGSKSHAATGNFGFREAVL
jgi:hypothetical protein